jgi:hypothetical protein
MSKRVYAFVLSGITAATAVFGADQPAADAKNAVKEPAYRPLILPEKPQAPAVPSPKQEIPPEKIGKAAPTEADSAVRPTGIFILPDAEEKKNKQELWIYTQPQEEAALAEKRREEGRRIAEVEKEQGDKKLPSWAVDSEYRKYTQDGVDGPERGLWKTDSPSREPGWLFSDPLTTSEAPAAQDPFLSIGGISVEGIGTKPRDPGLIVAPAAGAKPADTPAPETGGLYQSREYEIFEGRSAAYNKKEKRVEDFHSGVNKPTTTERELERHHKPQKPL